MCVFVSLNAGSKKRWVVGGWFICLQTKPAGTIHVVQNSIFTACVNQQPLFREIMFSVNV